MKFNHKWIKVINKYIIIYFLLDSKIILRIKNDEKIVNNLSNNSKNKNFFFQNSKINEIQNKLIINKDEEKEIIKPRSYTFDSKKSNSNNNPIKINLANINILGSNTMRNYMNLLGNNENSNKNIKNIFLNTNKLPKIATRLSLSNFHKKININNNASNNNENNNNIGISNKFNNIFNKTSGTTIGFKGLTFNNAIAGLRNTNYKFNNINNLNSCKLLNVHNEIFKYKISKDIINPNNINNIKDTNNNKLCNLQFNNTNINKDKDKKKIHINKNTFNTKTIIHNNNKYYNNMKINKINNNLILFKSSKKEKDEIKEKSKGKENEEKNNVCEENNDSFLNEFNDLFSNVKANKDSQHFQGNNDENNKNNDSDDDDKEPDPRINFEQINRVNQSRPQTSYGGLNARRKNLQSAMQNKNKRPITSNIPE